MVGQKRADGNKSFSLCDFMFSEDVSEDGVMTAKSKGFSDAVCTTHSSVLCATPVTLGLDQLDQHKSQSGGDMDQHLQDKIS